MKVPIACWSVVQDAPLTLLLEPMADEFGTAPRYRVTVIAQRGHNAFAVYCAGHTGVFIDIADEPVLELVQPGATFAADNGLWRASEFGWKLDSGVTE